MALDNRWINAIGCMPYIVYAIVQFLAFSLIELLSFAKVQKIVSIDLIAWIVNFQSD